MTVIPAGDAGELAPGDLYSVEGCGPYMVVEMDDECAKELFGERDLSEYRRGVMALVVESPQFKTAWRTPGDACLVCTSGSDKTRADVVQLVPSKVVRARDVPDGAFFVAQPQGFAGEELFIKGAHGRCFKSDGSELKISFFLQDSMAEVLELHTDLPGDHRGP